MAVTAASVRADERDNVTMMGKTIVKGARPYGASDDMSLKNYSWSGNTLSITMNWNGKNGYEYTSKITLEYSGKSIVSHTYDDDTFVFKPSMSGVESAVQRLNGFRP
jgi:hypothetical protein